MFFEIRQECSFLLLEKVEGSMGEL